MLQQLGGIHSLAFARRAAPVQHEVRQLHHRDDYRHPVHFLHLQPSRHLHRWLAGGGVHPGLDGGPAVVLHVVRRRLWPGSISYSLGRYSLHSLRSLI